MTFSTERVDRELAALRQFNDCDVAQLSPSHLHDVSDALGRARRALDVLVVAAAGEVARRSSPAAGVGGLARKEGFSTPQEFVAKTFGTSTYEAKRMIDVGNALAGGQAVGSSVGTDSDDVGGAEDLLPRQTMPRYPYLARAVSSGELGVEAAALVTRTLDVVWPVMVANSLRDPVPDSSTSGSSGSATDEAAAELAQLERRLVDKAQVLTLREFRRVCERERAWRSPRDLVERERRQRAARSLYFGEDSEGMTVMTAKMDATSAAPVKAWIEAQVRHAFQQRRNDPGKDGSDIIAFQIPGFEDLSESQRRQVRDAFLNDNRRAGQIRLDALVSLARHGLDCDSPTSGVKTTVVLRANAEDLEDSLALGECDQLTTPISMGTLRAMAVDAQIIPMVMGGGSLPLDVGRARRYFTTSQRVALA